MVKSGEESTEISPFYETVSSLYLIFALDGDMVYCGFRMVLKSKSAIHYGKIAAHIKSLPEVIVKTFTGIR